MTDQQRSHWLRFALLGSLLTPLAHITVLIANGQNPIPTPVSELSRGDLAWLQNGALVLFGLAHIALAVALGGLDKGRLWPVARGLLVAAGLGNMYLAYYFVTSTDAALYGPDANDPLWIIASLTGLAMGAVQPGLARQAKGLGAFAVVMLGAWLWLIPTILLVNASWLGLYERIVGVVYVVWVAGVSWGLLRVSR
ncbi:MAG: DUF998 domain-containing protein [Xanthomonadales bacterium]|jgi:hypothetical protein|nr:DUF998 domain-containing protein [Xanthomonadales bacterium]